MASLSRIRKHYGVPAKQGMTVRHGNRLGVITQGSRSGGMYVRVKWNPVYLRWNDCHPFDLDYLVDGKWVSGEALRAGFDAQVDAWNEWLNAMPLVPGMSS